MKKQCLIAFFLFIIGGLTLVVPQLATADHEIVGAAKCKACHKSKTGDQWKIWTESAHSMAYETLGSPESLQIASDLGLGDPQKEAACLKCHATRASLGDGAVISESGRYDDSEGVGCEACHGAGSDYRPRKIMIDPNAARKAGLLTDRSEEACTRCHNEESPTFRPFDVNERWADIAHPVPGKAVVQKKENPLLADADTLQEVLFESSVGYVIFPHDLHVTDAGLDCVECHHQIHAVPLDTPHPDYLTSSWINCQACHSPVAETDKIYYQCSACHHDNPDSIADETLSSKVVIHKSCWKCHDTGTGVDASTGCVECHIKDSDE